MRTFRAPLLADPSQTIEVGFEDLGETCPITEDSGRVRAAYTSRVEINGRVTLLQTDKAEADASGDPASARMHNDITRLMALGVNIGDFSRVVWVS